VLNLCVNAGDAMPEGGDMAIVGDIVTIRSDGDLAVGRSGGDLAVGKSGGDLAAGRYVRLSVSDTGSGMDPETLRRAAEPFYSTKTVGKGTGLGLSMVHGLAAQSGGMLRLESTPNHGTTATIWLPVDEDATPAAKKQMPAPVASPQRELSILLVDDDELVRVATGEMLADLGHATTQASSGEEALRTLRQHAAFDLMITDYLMPGMTGVELARIVRMAQPALPVMLVSGYASIKDVEGGGLPRLAKPFSTSDLSHMITETLVARAVAHASRPASV
jgi:CheY-like chemotaxis protein